MSDIMQYGKPIKQVGEGAVKEPLRLPFKYDPRTGLLSLEEGVNTDFAIKNGFKNKLINGAFDRQLWQRGTSISLTSAGTARAYQADRWVGGVAGTSAAATYSRQTFTLGQTDVPGNPEYFLRFDVTNGGDATNGAAYLEQAIENVITIAGKTYMLSPWIKTAAAETIAVEIIQYFGTGGSPSTNVNTFVQKITTTTSWARYLIPITVPSITGKTIGSDGSERSCTWVRFWFSAGSAFNSRTSTLGIQTGTYDFAMVQLELGEVATEFERRPIGIEQVLCYRYAYVFIAQKQSSKLVLAAQGSTTSAEFVPVMPVEMRVSPTASLSSVSNWVIGDGTATTAVSTFTNAPNINSLKNGGFICTFAAFGATYRPVYFERAVGALPSTNNPVFDADF